MQENQNVSLPILFYDSECPLCLRFKQSLEKLPGTENLGKVSIRENWIYDKFPQLDIKECHEAIHLIDSEGKVFKAGEVIQWLVKFYPGVSHFSWLAESNVGKKTIDFFYKTVQEYRKKKYPGCYHCNHD
jgi:predicted DCC family thiol-disulfide oxidoreductase YuxK